MSRRDPIDGLTQLTALDRTTQILPVPLAGLSPVRRQPSALVHTYRRHQPAALVVLAALATSGAVWLSASPRSFTVEASASAVQVDGAVLVQTQPGLTDGERVFIGQATLAFGAMQHGTLSGAAVMTWKGAAAAGRCVLHVLSSSVSEVCLFRSGATQLTSADRFDAASRTWLRHYGDGVNVTIAVPIGSDVIPIPFPLGR